MSIPAIGPITARTWALEIGEVRRFSSIKKAISYRGLCGAEKSTGNSGPCVDTSHLSIKCLAKVQCPLTVPRDRGHITDVQTTPLVVFTVRLRPPAVQRQ
jgi:hypothetical protein